MFEIIICLSLCKYRRGLCHQGKDEIVKEQEKGMLNEELTDIEWQIEAEFVAYFIRETCFLQTKCSKKLSRTIPPKAEGIIPRSLLRNLSSELALRFHTCDYFKFIAIKQSRPPKSPKGGLRKNLYSNLNESPSNNPLSLSLRCGMTSKAIKDKVINGANSVEPSSSFTILSMAEYAAATL